MRNKYIKHTHFSERKIREILRLFSEDLTAVQIASLTGINHNSINRVLKLFRKRIFNLILAESSFKGQIDVDESFFGSKRVKGKTGRVAYGKTIVFGFYKRNEKVYTEIVENCYRVALQAIIKWLLNLSKYRHFYYI